MFQIRAFGVKMRIALLMTAGLMTASLATAAPAAAALPGPTGLTPNSSSAAVSTNPVLGWDAVPGAAKYRVQIATVSGFTSTIYNVTTYQTTATPPSELPTGTLYWRVQGIDGSNGSGDWSQDQFTKDPAAGPDLIEPALHDSLPFPAKAPLFRWQPLNAYDKYQIQVDDATDFINPSTDDTTPNDSYVLTTNQAAGPYYWRVRGVSDNNVVTSWSETFDYTVGALDAPTLLSPANSPATMVSDLTMHWSAVPGAASYKVQISPNGDFANNTVLTTSSKATTYTPATALDNSSYFWRVQAVDASGHVGTWSAVWQFTRSWTDTITPLTPADNDNAVQTPTFAWTPIHHADRYILETSSDVNFSPGNIGDCTVNHTSYTPVVGDQCQPQSGQTTYWHVRGIDAPHDDLGVWSATQSFTWVPASPTQLSPADGDAVSVPTLSWSPVAGAVDYKVTIYSSTGQSVQNATTVATSWTPPNLLDTSKQPFHWIVVANYADGGSSLPPANVLTAPSFTVTGFTASATNPDPTAPANGSSSARLPAMAWTAVTGASYYKISLGVANTGIVVTDGTQWHYPAATLTDDLISGLNTLAPGSYDWFVTAYDSGNAPLSSGALGNYTITQTVLGAADYHIAGCAGSPCAGLQDTPTFSWSPSTNPQYAGFYFVYIATDPNLTNIVYSYKTQYESLTPAVSILDSQAGQAYYWFVRPCKTVHACGPLGPTAPVSFEKASNPIELTGPANSPSTVVADAVTFTWRDFLDTNGDAVPAVTQEARQYHLQVSTTSDFSSVIDDQTMDAPSYTAASKTYPEGPLWWRVQAIDGSNNDLTWSQASTLTKQSAAPTLEAPNDGSSQSGSPFLSWDPQAYAASYEVELAKNGDTNFSSANRVFDATTKQTAYSRTSTLAVSSTAYVWHVRRLDADNRPGPWSTPRTFFVVGTAPSLGEPADGAQVDPRNVAFTWGAVQGAAKYRFQRSANKTSNAEQQDTVMLTWAPTSLYSDGTWWWRVAALDSDGHVLANSPWRSFVVDITPPTLKSKTPTSNASITGDWTATFSEPVVNVNTGTMTLRLAGASGNVAAKVHPSSDGKSATLTPSKALVPGGTYRLSLSSAITDAVGNPLAATSWTSRTSTVVQQNSPAVLEAWDRDTSSSALGHNYVESATAGASDVLRFTGTTVTLLAERGPDGGYANVHVDSGAAKKVSFYAAARQWQRSVYTVSGLTNSTHTLTVSVLGTHPSSSHGSFVRIDGAKVGSTSVNDSSSAWRTKFRRLSTSKALGGSYDTESFTASGDNGPRPTFTVTFVGTKATLYFTKSPRSGKAYVSLDGVRQATVDLYSSSTTYRSSWSSKTLKSSSHKLVVTLAGTRNSASNGTQVGLDQISIG